MDLQRQIDRLRVLQLVEDAIQQGLDRDSVSEYFAAAIEYGRKYQVETAVREWAMEGRNEFSLRIAMSWAQTLP